jgi:CxxC motif-containing protein (DUF1111 family)
MGTKIRWRAAGVVLIFVVAATPPAGRGQNVAAIVPGQPCGHSDRACAPTGFTNATNGFEPQSGTAGPGGFNFDDDRAAFDETESVLKPPKKDIGGLGPVYNSTSCVACHQNAGFVVKRPAVDGSDAVSGTSTQVAELRAGHNEFAAGKTRFKEAPGGSVIQQRAIDPKVQERVPDQETIRTLRFATSVLGDGFVEAIRDADIRKVRDDQPPEVRGVAVCVPVVEEAIIEQGEVKRFTFTSRIGRFGWKDQEASLLNFAAGAYVAEMGITSPLQRIENSSLGRCVDEFDTVEDPEDEAVLKPEKGKQNFIPQPFGADVEAFTRFMRSTMAPPQADVIEPTNVTRGRMTFNRVGCATCHHPEFITAPEKTKIGDFAVPAALANKRILPYSDFLLHDIGTGDGIVQTQYSELPPTGLVSVVREVPPGTAPFAGSERRVRVDTARLNSLLAGTSEPREVGGPALGIELRDAACPKDVLPPIQVETAGSKACDASLKFTMRTARMIRTAPLWGLRTRPQLLHDGRALTLLDAIKAHAGQASGSRTRFIKLSGEEKQLLLDFLNFL